MTEEPRVEPTGLSEAGRATCECGHRWPEHDASEWAEFCHRCNCADFRATGALPTAHKTDDYQDRGGAYSDSFWWQKDSPTDDDHEDDTYGAWIPQYIEAAIRADERARYEQEHVSANTPQRPGETLREHASDIQS